jgi:hypothetical protein
MGFPMSGKALSKLITLKNLIDLKMLAIQKLYLNSPWVSIT